MSRANQYTASVEIVGSNPHVEPQPQVIRHVSELVGLDGEIKKVIGHLAHEETEEFDVIAIIGMPGIGKTTLAWTAFRNEWVAYEFPIRIWINVRRETTSKDVFLNILKEFTSLTEEIKAKDELELTGVVAGYLENVKFLIVVDDVPSTGIWNRIRVVLPASNKKGKVMITSRHKAVGLYANRLRPPLELHSLNDNDSWLLLQSQVFGGRGCPPELESIGNLIARECSGMPPAILAMADALMEVELSCSNETGRRKGWTKLCSRVPHYHINTFYESLSYYLRPCFLYLGIFPYDYEIPVWRLVQLWIAEGFIPARDSTSLEETAGIYLMELIDRYLVDICGTKINGDIKTCSLKRMQHEFCIVEAGHERENFFQRIKASPHGGLDPPVSQLHQSRRLCISSNILDFFSSKPFCPRVRSFLSFSSDEVLWTSEYSSAIPEAFRLVRVLDVAKPIKFTKISSHIYDLIHLRFLALSIDFGFLPSQFSKLWNLRTFIIHTTSRTLEIKADIWSLPQLRHFITNASATLPKRKPSKHSWEGQNLQTLALISPQSCTEEVIGRAINLKKLGIRGRLSLLFHENSGSFDCLRLLSRLEALKLVNDVYPMSPSEV